jgi:DNA-binding beta-propeller fold protein YncE
VRHRASRSRKPAGRPGVPAGHANALRLRGTGARLTGVTAIFIFCALAVSALALAPPALAAFGAHHFTTTFGAETSTPKNPYPLLHAGDVAVDNSAGPSDHDIYVADPANHRVEKFDSTGHFLLMFGKEVNKTAIEDLGTEAEQNLCIAASGDTCQPGVEGSTPGAFSGGEFNRLFLAVDNSTGPSAGDVYVADPGDGSVTKFAESGNLVASWGTAGQLGGFSTPAGIAVDSSGNIFVWNGYGAERIEWYEQDGTLHSSFFADDGYAQTGLAVDAEDNLYRVLGFGLQEVEKTSNTGEGLGRPDPRADATNLAIDPSTNGLYVIQAGGFVDYFAPNCAQSCTPLEEFGAGHLASPGGLGVDALSDAVYVANRETGTVSVFPATIIPTVKTEPPTNPEPTSLTLNGHVDPDSVHGGTEVTKCFFEYGETTAYDQKAECEPSAPLSNPAAVSANLTGLTPETTYHYRLVSSSANEELSRTPDATFTPHAVAETATGQATEITASTATLHGSFTGDGVNDTHYYFEYGTSTHYLHRSPLPPGTDQGTAVGVQNVSTPIADLVPNTLYRYRIAAENHFGTSYGVDREFTTFQGPTIGSFSSSDVTATSAILHAQINPQGFQTTCHFEYGTTTAYGSTEPCPGSLSGSAAQQVKVELTGLQQGATYHFRVVAESEIGTTTSEDQSFEFFPPNCPNAAVRQQTGSNYLPDCRGYELVSPGNAEGTLFYPGGPNTGLATNPPRFSYTGAYSEIPGANAIDTAADLYVATRTDQGWVSKYVGIPGNQAGCAGGPPTEATSTIDLENPPWLTNTVQADPQMSQFLDWNDGAPVPCSIGSNGVGDANWELAPPSNAPYLWNADGTFAQRLPTNLGGVPGAEDALKCPYQDGQTSSIGLCSGETKASGDLSHIAFSSNKLSFAENGIAHTPGLIKAPGSAYDNDVAAQTVTLISKLPSGKDIPQDPAVAAIPPEISSGKGFAGIEQPGGEQEFIRFPAISTDGSHILMSTGTTVTPLCYRGTAGPKVCQRFIDTPVHLYMSIDDAVAVEIAAGKPVHYVGMTPEGSRVFFTSEEQLTAEDKDTSTDLYMWSEAGQLDGHPLTLISKGDNAGAAGEPGNSDGCSASWTAKCDVLPYSGYAYSWLLGGKGGNGISDSAIAANGDIYFYSPEQLDGDRGVLGQQNLYDYRGGEVRYVTTLNPEARCENTGYNELICGEGPIERLEVTPEDTHMAFVTATRLTSYENAGHLEMYSYTPSSGAIVCDSCNPDGKPATADVSASQDGLFLTNDGRTFFSTTEALVPQDTDEAEDVYEYVDGRAQLITPGTGTGTAPVAEFGENGKGVNLVSIGETPGLVGVDAEGTDVYFSTFDSLIPEDHNGNFLKFYDARSDGGFPQPTPVPPCAAAEECHGAGSEAPALPTQGTAPALSGGNVTPQLHSKKHRKKKVVKHHKKKVVKKTAATKSTAQHHRARASANRRAGK